MREIPEIKLGTVLFSIAEAKPGHEKEYNRWYERDHFFAGCMVGANFFSGRRWVATKPMKAQRFPAQTPEASPRSSSGECRKTPNCGCFQMNMVQDRNSGRR